MSDTNKSLTLNDLCSHACRTITSPAENNINSNYVLMVPRKNKAWVGLGVQQIIRYRIDRFCIDNGDGDVKEILCDNPFDLLDQVLGKKASYFFMISLDLHRPNAVSGLPTMIWVQAKHEIEVDVSKDVPYASSDETAESGLIAEKLNRQFFENKITDLSTPETMNEVNWESVGDNDFIKRLDSSIEALQKIDGKIITTRAYSKSLSGNPDPYRLYEIYNHLESSCAASHFIQLDEDTVSLGCTPENIFSLEKNILDFDVIASTRGVSSDPDKDARWESELRSNPKELKEHTMALGRYQKRLGELCKEGTVEMDHHLDVRLFRYVRHLYSHLYGQLRDEISFFDLLKGSSPALSTYPDELIPVADDGVTATKYYGGVVGRVSSGFSDADVFLNIRSLFINKNEISTTGGVGVVRESRSDQELVEVKNKLRCVMEAEALWESEFKKLGNKNDLEN